MPAVFLSFFEITCDASTASLQDNRLKNDINSIKAALTKSGFKTRFAVVIVGDQTIAVAPELEERLAGIKRATGLDPKSAFFFLPPPGSRTELTTFVNHVLSALQPVCIEYYRDLTKHARRKKNRGFVPPPTAAPTKGTSQSLSTQGWNVRYEFKQGVFAEFRQEMDAAERHYSFAVEELFHAEGVLETTPSWSTRWDDARCLADITALRVLRCQLWRGMTTGAAESWCNYKERTQDLIDRRGKGNGTYGWAAWESRWAEIMAQLIYRANLSIFHIKGEPLPDDSVQLAANNIFAPPEKAYSTMERLPPFHFAHHPGYWLRLSARDMRKRRRRAKAIPEEDRTPPDQSTATQVANRARNYETYMVPAPHDEVPASGAGGFNHLDKIRELSELAVIEFGNRRQTRADAQIQLDLAQVLIEEGHYQHALGVIRPVWEDMPWRREGWYAMASEVLSVIHQCALQQEDSRLLVELQWEAMCDFLDLGAPAGTGLKQPASDAPIPEKEIVMDSQRRLSPISLTFAFSAAEGHVGDQIQCQIALVSHALPSTEPLRVSQIEFSFNGNPHLLHVRHDDTKDGQRLVQTLAIKEDVLDTNSTAKALMCSANLALDPQQCRAFNFAIPLRDPELFCVTDARMVLDTEDFRLRYVYTQAADLLTRKWWIESEEGLISRQIPRDEPHRMTVLPKPPKVQLQFIGLKDQYFTDEKVKVEIEAVNDESESIKGSLTVQVVDSTQAHLSLRFDGEQLQETDADTAVDAKASKDMGELLPGGHQSHHLNLDAPSTASECALAIVVTYALQSDPEIPISKTLTLTLTFASPFEANYELLPRLDASPWPSFFSLSSHTPEKPQSDTEADGIPQRWSLASNIASFATEQLVIESASLTTNSVSSNTICTLTDPASTHAYPLTLTAKTLTTLPFSLTTRKKSLEDRRPSTLDLALSLRWRRHDTDASTNNIFTTTLAIPKYTLPGAEPRVLCTATYPPPPSADPDKAVNKPGDQVTVTYTLENPSMHFLTFTLTMEASDAFAFQGPKYKSLSLTPMSRGSVVYDLFAISAGEGGDVRVGGGQGKEEKGRWVWPVLRVVDSYFQKTLRVLDAGEGVKGDGKGGVGVRVFGG